MSYLEQSEPRGWLRFLIILMMWLIPVFGALRTFGEIVDTESLNPMLVGDSTWATYKISAWILFGIQALAFFIAGYRLANVHNPTSPRLAIATFWIAGPLLSAAFILLASEALDANLTNGAEGARVIGAIVVSAFWAAVWTAYLLISKQVKSVYRAEHLESDVDDQPVWYLSLSREQRKYVFFAIGWIVLILVYVFLFDSEYDGSFWEDYERNWSKIAIWAIVPPALIFAGIWIFKRFVDGQND